MSKCVFVTGGSGFVGSAIIDELLARNYSVHTLVHKNLTSLDPRARAFPGSLFDAAAIDRAMADCSAVIHLVGIIMENRRKGITFERIHFEGTKSVVDAARRNNISRYLHMSALGVRPDAVSNYHKTKFRAEEYVRASGLDWTIFRPSLIHGPKGEFMKMEAAWARHKAPPFLFMPYFGAGLLGRGGAGKLQPIYVGDIARAFVDSLENPKTVHEIFPIAGPDEFIWPQLHHISSQAIVSKRRRAIPVPAWYARLITHLTPPSLLPFNRDQVIMSQEDNTTDLSKFKAQFGWDPKPFASTLQTYAKSL